jgi:hypothetical protein
VAGVQDALATFTLPTPTPWQNRVRRTAIALIG